MKASVVGLDVRTFTPYTKTYHGVYGEDFVSFGQFKSSANPIDSDSTLIQLFEAEHADVVDKHTFKFSNNQVTYTRQVNAETLESEIEHQIEETVLTPLIDQTWSESLFYGIGNKNM